PPPTTHRRRCGARTHEQDLRSEQQAHETPPRGGTAATRQAERDRMGRCPASPKSVRFMRNWDTKAADNRNHSTTQPNSYLSCSKMKIPGNGMPVSEKT